MIMTTLNFQFPAHVPNVNEQFTRSTRFIVGYSSGSCFIRRGEYDCLHNANIRYNELREKGFDARIIEASLNLYLIG